MKLNILSFLANIMMTSYDVIHWKCSHLLPSEYFLIVLIVLTNDNIWVKFTIFRLRIRRHVTSSGSPDRIFVFFKIQKFKNLIFFTIFPKTFQEKSIFDTSDGNDPAVYFDPPVNVYQLILIHALSSFQVGFFYTDERWLVDIWRQIPRSEMTSQTSSNKVSSPFNVDFVSRQCNI